MLRLFKIHMGKLCKKRTAKPPSYPLPEEIFVDVTTVKDRDSSSNVQQYRLYFYFRYRKGYYVTPLEIL